MIKKRLEFIQKFNNEFHFKYFIRLILIIAIGGMLGILSKYADTVPADTQLYNIIFTTMGMVTTDIGLWVFLASVFAIYSHTPTFAMLNTLGFFTSMLSTYYLYSRYICGFYSVRIILVWSIYAFLASFSGYIIWYGKRKRGISIIIASLPIALLLMRGYSFFYTNNFVQILDMIFASILLHLFSKGFGKDRYFITLVVAIIFAILYDRLSIASIFFGGL